MSAKCLVVEDDPDMLQMLADMVQAIGYQPLKARDGDEAWEIYKRESPGIVVSDIHMPNRNGLLLLRDIRSHNPHVPVILITGYFQYRGIMQDYAPDAYLEKPFSMDDLRQALQGARPLISTEL
jgi:DNA-binding NtrC family response regulator